MHSGFTFAISAFVENEDDVKKWTFRGEYAAAAQKKKKICTRKQLRESYTPLFFRQRSVTVAVYLHGALEAVEEDGLLLILHVPSLLSAARSSPVLQKLMSPSLF